jgi:hypothetical protein
MMASLERSISSIPVGDSDTDSCDTRIGRASPKVLGVLKELQRRTGRSNRAIVNASLSQVFQPTKPSNKGSSPGMPSFRGYGGTWHLMTWFQSHAPLLTT